MTERLEKGTKVRFVNYNDYGMPEVVGKIAGHAEEIKKMYPEEYAELPDNEVAYLIKFTDRYGNTKRYVSFPNEIIEVLLEEEQ